jgi:hypothetical protein
MRLFPLIASCDYDMAFLTPSSSSGGRQLPTRVSNACDRCRRNKSRCDPYRPCSLCTRANVECLAGNNDQQPRPTKRKRPRGPSRDGSASLEALVPEEVSSYAPPRQELDEASNDTGNAVFDPQPQVECHQDVDSRRQSVTDAQVDSAMGIAQKVGLHPLTLTQILNSRGESQIYQLSGQGTPVLRRTTSAIPGGDVYGKPTATRTDRAQRRPVASIIGYSLPSAETMRALLEEYFEAVHWFSLVSMSLGSDPSSNLLQTVWRMHRKGVFSFFCPWSSVWEHGINHTNRGKMLITWIGGPSHPL